VWSDGGVFKVRKADANDPAKEAHGFVTAAVASGASATVYTDGANDQVSGLTPGPVWLSETAGGVTQAPTTPSGGISQLLGVAVTATKINVDIQPSVELV
jgi:hypothetical protein